MAIRCMVVLLLYMGLCFLLITKATKVSVIRLLVLMEDVPTEKEPDPMSSVGEMTHLHPRTAMGIIGRNPIERCRSSGQETDCSSD